MQSEVKAGLLHSAVIIENPAEVSEDALSSAVVTSWTTCKICSQVLRTKNLFFFQNFPGLEFVSTFTCVGTLDSTKEENITNWEQPEHFRGHWCQYKALKDCFVFFCDFYN